MTRKFQLTPGSRWSACSRAALASIALLLSAPSAHATSGYAGTWNGIYGASNSDAAGCQLCHGTSTQNLNPYGFAISPRCSGWANITAGINGAAGDNSDGDAGGFSNLEEINANAQPGWTTGNIPVWSRADCTSAGTNTYTPPAGTTLDPAGNQPPTSDPNGPYNGTVGIAVTFDGSGSSDPDGTIVAYDWDFGDGNTGTGVTPTNTYAAAGTYTVSLTVTDDAGATASASTSATIVAAPQDPVADPNGPYNGFQGIPLTFDGSASFDPDGGAITQYNWDFGDGNTGTGVSPSHSYAATGTYTVTLTVVDDEGATSLPATTSATIDLPPANIPPTADANGPYSGSTGQPVTFDGSGSRDPDGTIASYDWDFGDGTVQSVTTPTVQHTYAAPGVYDVSLVVTDDQGAASPAPSTTTATITEPVCTGITITNAEWRAQGNGQLRVTAQGVRDGPITLSNAYNQAQLIDTKNGRGGSANFNVNGRNLNPVPCRVRVDQVEVGLCGEADVINAPADCAPNPAGPIARGDTYATPAGKALTVQLSRVSGVLYNDFDQVAGDNVGNDGLTAVLVSGPTAGTLNLTADGSFTYTPNGVQPDNSNDSFTYRAQDADGNLSQVATVNIHITSDQPDFKIMMNYELGMHCTGFEFSYCCVLPPYNSILAQVVKPQNPGNPQSNADFPRVLEGDPNNGLDGLGRETVLRDYDAAGNIHKYYLEYFHDAQPRREGNMPGSFNDQTSTLISDIEGNSMLYHNTPYDSALVDSDGSLTGVPGRLVRTNTATNRGRVVGDGDYTDATDNYANGWLNHFYIYANLEGTLNGTCVVSGDPPTVTADRCASDDDCDVGAGEYCDLSLDRDKIRLGVSGMVEYPANVGAALQPMGPVSSTPVPFDNVLTFSGDTGTVVYTQMKVLENLPVMLTSPRIWEALGLPLTPFEDSINFFGAPGSVDEDSIRPYVAMKARLHTANCDEATGACTKGDAVIASNGQPVIGHGTAPIDIPNCERCHAVPAYQPDGITPNVNSPSYVREGETFGPMAISLQAITELEINYWKSIYPSLTTGSDWYARLKGAAVNMLALHDADVGTDFLANYPAASDILGLPPEKQIPQNTRMGHGSVICQNCHGDNVIAAVNPWGPGSAGGFIPRPITEVIHRTHRNQSEGGVIVFNDALGRDGGCQGCHPAHRSDGVMDNYPITVAGNNANADGDNRLNQGGCFVGRDVHSNPLKDVDGAETPAHLNAVGQWLADNVFYGQAGEPGGTADNRGIWCTNCHSQLGQEIWASEDCNDLINGDCVNNVRALGSLGAIEAAVGLAPGQAVEMLDPRVNPNDPTAPYPGYSEDYTHAIWSPASVFPDAGVATIEVGPDGPVGSVDADGDFSVNILSFCTTEDCVTRINSNKGDQSQWRYAENGAVDGVAGFIDTANAGVAVPFSAATDGRDHWLAAGEPHCADCHAAPYVEQSGNINPFPPFNYPAKASLMRYSRGHQDLGCQACHESIHGLYPVSAAIDTTSYAQAAALNHDGSHGPLKCGACHQVGGDGLPTWLDTSNGNVYGITDFDSGVTWAHTYTAEANVLDSTCQNCHGDERDEIGAGELQYVRHADVGRTSRLMMDKAETAQLGHVLGTTAGEREALCSACHGQGLGNVSCDDSWRRHLTQGRVSESVWEDISIDETGTLCGW